MKNILLVLAFFATYTISFSQEILKWSVGEPKIDFVEDVAHITYAINVSMNSIEDSPVLGTSTIRFFYDKNYLSNLKIENIENGYRQSGLKESNAVFGEIFGFSDNQGVFTQLNLIDAAKVNPIYIKAESTHVLDLKFTITEKAINKWFDEGVIALPLVLDNNPATWNLSHELDCGYLVNDSGITGSYFINGNMEKVLFANDEVDNYAWNVSRAFDGRVNDFDDKAGTSSKLLKLEEFYNSLSTEDYFNDGKDLFSIYKAPTNSGVVVNYSFHYDTSVLIEFFDVKGALITKKSKLNYSQNTKIEEPFKLNNINEQVLLVRLTTDRAILFKKIANN